MSLLIATSFLHFFPENVAEGFSAEVVFVKAVVVAHEWMDVVMAWEGWHEIAGW